MGQVGFAAGFAQHTTYGTVEVIVPWPDGGFALYFFDRSAGRWSGPWPCVPASVGVVDSVSWHEGDYQSQDGEHNNFELVTVEDGRTVHWFRDNGPPNRWTRARVGLGGDLADAAGATLTRTNWEPRDGDSAPHHNLLLVAATRKGGGMYQQRQLMTLHSEVYDWSGAPFEEIVQLYATSTRTEPVTGPFDGAGWVLGTVGSAETDFEDNYRGREMYVAVRGDGTLRSFEAGRYPLNIGSGVRGRPAIIQSDRGRSDPVLGFGRHGNYEVFAPSRTGGIRHFWRPNPGYADENNDWVAVEGTIGTGFYDEVSVVQLRDEDTPDGDSTAPLWLFARCDGQSWVDLFQQRHIGDGFVWERLPTLGDPGRRPQVRLTVEEDFVVVNPLKRGEVRRIAYTCFEGSPVIWVQQDGGGWVSSRGDALRDRMRASTVRTDGEAAAEEGLDTFERKGHLDTPSMTAGTVVRIWGTTDPSADPNVTPPPRDAVACVIATGRPGNLAEVHAFPEADRVRVEVTHDAGPVCLIAEIGEGEPAEHRPYGHAYHAFDRPAGRFVCGELRQSWQEDLVRAPGHELRPGASYTVVVRVMDTRGYWSETVAPVTLRQRRVDVTVDRVDIVASGDSGSADGWFSAEVYTGLVRQGVVERVRRWQFGDEDNWAELEAGDVFGTGGSLHAAGPPWTATIGPGPTAVRPFGVRLEIFDEDGLFEPDEHASGAWETEDDRPVVDAPFTVRTDREPSYATAEARGRYTIAYVSPPGQPDRLDWRSMRVDTSPDLPAGADYNGDGTIDPGVWRPWPGAWVIELSTGGPRRYELGEPGDLPVPGDYSATGSAEPAVWRPGAGTLRTLTGPASAPADLPPHRLGVLAVSLAALVQALRAEGRDAEADAVAVELARVEGPAYATAAMWLQRSVAAHPADIPAQLTAAHNAWDIVARLTASPAVTADQLRVLVAQLDLLARFLAFGSTDPSDGVRAATLARTVYAGLGGHELEIARSWNNQALTHHEVAFHPAQPDAQAQLAAQRDAAGHAAEAYAVVLRGPLDDTRRLAVARELDRVARLRVFGSADFAPFTPIARTARDLFRAEDWADLATSYVSEAVTHHEMAFHPRQQDAAAEFAAQRAAAKEAAELYFDHLPGGDPQAAAGNLRQLVGLLTTGLDDADTSPAAETAREYARRAAELAASLTG
ncbi:hypothetical protein [Dactylosporangium sp. NPDC005555]|uniref:hypothetical protein n=1 Tax=Dactylosporangium sp. NPDC005555 TaxID=3154889 RepID=UPI0033AB2557